MKHNEAMQELHNRATSGLSLTEQERTELETWYAEQDEKEATILPLATAPELKILQGKVEAGLTELHRTTQRLEALSDENKALRQEINGLYRQLSTTQTAQHG